MPLPERLGRTAAGFWGPVLSGVSQHVTTQELFDTYINPNLPPGEKLTFQEVTQIGQLRGNAAGVVGAGEQLAAAGAEEAITAGMIGQPFYARPLAEQQANPMYELIVGVTLQGPEGQTSGAYRMVWGADRPETVGALLEAAGQFAQETAARYNQVLVGTGTLLLNAI